MIIKGKKALVVIILLGSIAGFLVGLLIGWVLWPVLIAADFAGLLLGGPT